MNEDPRSEPGLFDLPLEPVSEAMRRERSRPSRPAPPPDLEELAVEPETLPLFSDEEIDRHLDAELEIDAPGPDEGVAFEPAGPRAVPDPPQGPETAELGARFRATCGDLAVLAAAGLAAAVGARALSAPVGGEQLAPLLLFVVAFSFVYAVVPLAFWGGTPGMIWAGLIARTPSSEPLSFGQSVLRWLAGWATFGLLGLPGLLALTGRSLVDRLSASATYRQADPVTTA